MANNYFYKGTPISQIVTNSSSAINVPGYNSFPFTPASYSSLIPNDFSFYYNSSGTVTSVSSISTAQSINYTSPSPTIDIQNDYSGCKSISFYGIAAGGGGGAAGGAALLKINSGNSGNASSGPGGAGGQGGLIYSQGLPIGLYKTINISIGTGTGGGNFGGTKSNIETAALDPAKAEGNSGNGGGPGNSTSITLSNTNSPDTVTYTAPGGNGANGGNGGTVNYDGNSAPYNFGESPGTTGANGNQPAVINVTPTASTSYNWLPIPTIYGVGGNGGGGQQNNANDPGNPGAGGSGGYFTLIPLYD
jgi:hypothetical protein